MKIYHDNIGEVQLIDWMGDDKRAVNAARVSFLKDDLGSSELTDRDEKLIRFLVNHRHTSPFEHMQATFRIKCPLFVRAQIMRHRTFSYNEVSRRYTEENIEFYLPECLYKQADKNLQCSSDERLENEYILKCIYKHSTDASFESYQILLDNGVSRESARMVLPQNLYTTFWMSGNLHNFLKFLDLRLDKHVQYETVRVAQGIETQLRERFPATLKAFDKHK